MKKEDIKMSFDDLKPNDFDEKRMLNNILYYSDNKGKVRNMKATENNIIQNSDRFGFRALKKALPALAMVFVITASVLTYNFVSNYRSNNIGRESTDNATNLIGKGAQDSLALAEIKNQFQIGNKHYIILSDEQKADFKFLNTINSSDIGEKLTTITTSVDASLKGSEVYKYIPAGGEAVVAVLKDNEYKLFKFLYFDSYIKNQDEDTSAYLKLYGINSPADIAKIQFIGHSDKAKIEGKVDVRAEINDTAKITEFYNYYSVIKNSSDKYFSKLLGQSNTNSTNSINTDHREPAVLPPDQPKNQTGELPPDYTARPAADLPANSVGTDSDKPVSNTNAIGIAQPKDAVKSTNVAEPTKPATGAGTTYDRGSVSGTASPAGSGTVSGPASGSGSTSSSGPVSGSGSAPAGSASIPGSAGSAIGALSNSVTIRIYNKSGVYFDAEYYPNIGFISRHEVNDSFAAFLKGFIG